jgi:hypothetical protein
MHGPVTTGAMNQQNLAREQEGRQFQQTEGRLQGKDSADVLLQRARDEQSAKYQGGMLSAEQLRLLDQQQANQATQQYQTGMLGVAQKSAETAQMREKSIAENIAFQRQFAGSQTLKTVETMAQSIQHSSMMMHGGVGLPQGATPEQTAAWQAANPIISYDDAFKIARERATSVNPYGMRGSVGIPPPNEAGTYNFNDLTQPNDTAQ